MVRSNLRLSRRNLILIGAVLGILIIAGAVYRFAMNDRLSFELIRVELETLISSITAPDDVKNAIFVISPALLGGIYSDRSSGIVSRELPGVSPEDTILSYDRIDGHQAYLVGHIDRENLYSIDIVFDDNVISSRQGYLMRDITISPDALNMAYTEAPVSEEKREANTPSAAVTDITKWTVLVVPATGGEPLRLGTGYQPLFLDATHILYFAAEGVKVTNIRTLESKSYPFGAFPSPGSVRAAQSPDGAYVAWTDPTNKTSVYKVTSIDPFRVARIIELPVPRSGDIALTQSALYHLDIQQDSGEILWQYPLDGGDAKKVRTFPNELRLSKMIP